MPLFKRLTAIFQAKANKTIDAMEDPREMLDLSYEKQIELLRDFRRGVVEVTAAKKRLEQQANEHRSQLERFDGQARQALSMGREDLARLALERKQEAAAQVATFDAQVAQLEDEQQRLVQAEARLAAKLEAFRTKKEVIKAQYTAAQATVRVGEAVSGLSEEMTDVGYAIQRAEDKTAQLKSRGDAIGELIEAGVLTDSLDSGTPLTRELDALGATYNVEVELEAMKRELSGPTAPKQLEGPR